MEETTIESIKTKEFLVCVDSDGCAMDTMNIKHFTCFGPKAIEVWHLETLRETFLEEWNKINLFSMTRGINRFKGLVNTFERMTQLGYDVPDLSSVRTWTEATKELSNRSLEKEISRTNDEQLKNTLLWSHLVNEAITQLEEDSAFSGVKEGLAVISQLADIAIVSSANGEAVEDEWTRHELVSFVKILLGQEAGTKAHCISELLKQGYQQENVLMVGDAPGDLEAAELNGVLFFPILVGKEEESWNQLTNVAMGKMLNGSYQGEYQQTVKEEFQQNLTR